MPSVVQYNIAWVLGLIDLFPFMRWFGWSGGKHWEYLAEHTNGTDPVTGMTAKEYEKKADWYSWERGPSRPALIRIPIVFLLILPYVMKFMIDYIRLIWWSIKSLVK